MRLSLLEEESSQSRRMRKPFRLHWTLRIPQSKISGSTAELTVEILPTGYFGTTLVASCFLQITNRALRPTPVESKVLTYADAGVSIDAGNSLVQRIKHFVRQSKRTGSDAEIGGFGGVFDLKATGYKDPVLVSGTDGVGTKLHVAVEAGVHGTVGRFLQNVPTFGRLTDSILSRYRFGRDVRQRSHRTRSGTSLLP